MSCFFQNLVPVKIKKGEKIFGELGAIDEVIFVCEGSYKIGFTINNRERSVVCLPFKTNKTNNTNIGSIIGGFECSYNRRSSFIYRSSTVVKGYYIRKQKWKGIEQDFPEFYYEMRRLLLQRYY